LQKKSGLLINEKPIFKNLNRTFENLNRTFEKIGQIFAKFTLIFRQFSLKILLKNRFLNFGKINPISLFFELRKPRLYSQVFCALKNLLYLCGLKIK